MIVVNLFGGPGAGKSTLAAALFAELKRLGVGCELVTEFAKDLAWENHPAPLQCQPYVFGQQLWRIERLRGKVEVAVTDSPIFLSALYAPPDTPPAFIEAVKAYAQRQCPFNVRVQRVKKYDKRGRFQTENEAVQIDATINREVPFWHAIAPGCPFHAPILARQVINNLGAKV